MVSAVCWGRLEDGDQVVKLAVDGAWKRDTSKGVAAWCVEEVVQDQSIHGYTFVNAVSSTGVEALAVLQALRWAMAMGIRKVQILTDSLEVVHALRNAYEANICIRNIIFDVLDVVSQLTYVSIVKVTRQVVRNAHNLARRL